MINSLILYAIGNAMLVVIDTRANSVYLQKLGCLLRVSYFNCVLGSQSTNSLCRIAALVTLAMVCRSFFYRLYPSNMLAVDYRIIHRTMGGDSNDLRQMYVHSRA
jgi:hypothetical protein